MLSSLFSNPLFIALASNAVVMSLVLFFAKRTFEKYLDAAFARSQLRYEVSLRAIADRDSDLYRSRMPVYAEINQAIYRARNAARECIAGAFPPDLLPDMPSFIRRVCSGYAPQWGGLQTPSV
jgi:hypothetical protein